MTLPPVAEDRSPSHRLGVRAAIFMLYGLAVLQFTRFYAVSATPYLRLNDYLAGHERLPFQYRILPALLLRGLYRAHLLSNGGMHSRGAFTPDRAPIFVLGFIGLLAASLLTQLLYRTFSRSRPLDLLVFPAFLFTIMWTYSVHVEANFSYPYDMLSVAFFSAGLVCVGRRWFAALWAVVLLGTLNRETTLFLIGVYVLDAASLPSVTRARPFGSRFDLRRVPWLRVLLLLASWLGIKLLLAHLYGANDRSEDFVRISDNLAAFRPRLWPALLNICGYMLPVVVLLRHDLRPMRFRNYLWILPAWFAVMLVAGVLVETRIYGELCPLIAVALVLLVENRLAPPGNNGPSHPTSLEEDNSLGDRHGG